MEVTVLLASAPICHNTAVRVMLACLTRMANIMHVKCYEYSHITQMLTMTLDTIGGLRRQGWIIVWIIQKKEFSVKTLLAQGGVPNQSFGFKPSTKKGKRCWCDNWNCVLLHSLPRGLAFLLGSQHGYEEKIFEGCKAIQHSQKLDLVPLSCIFAFLVGELSLENAKDNKRNTRF